MKKNNILNIFDLTDIQKGIFFETKRDNDNSFYTCQMIFDFNGTIDAKLFEEAWKIIICRHDVLRSAVHVDAHVSKLIIFDDVDLGIKFYDYSQYSPHKKQKNLETFLHKDLCNKFDLEKPPLMRFTLIKWDENIFKIIWTRHHILLDGGSVNRLINESFTVYFALLNKQPFELQQPTPYKEVFLRIENLNTINPDQWKEALNNISNATLLPYSSVENTLPKNICRVLTKIETDDLEKLQNFINQNGLTLNALLQAAWGITLSHYTSNHSIAFGVVRSYPNDVIKNCIGLFINTLPFCVEVTPSKKVIDFLHEIRNKNIFLRNNVYTSLTKIKEWCGISSDVPLYLSIVDYKPYSLNASGKERYKQFKIDVSLNLDVPYPLVLEVINCGDSLQVEICYFSNMFSEDHINSLLEHFKEILFSLTIDKNKKLGDLKTLSVSDMQKITEWNNTECNYPKKTVHQIFEEQVKRNPDAPAVIDESKTYSYQEINSRSNQLAHYLIEQGIANEAIIGICIKPDVDMIISVLAVLKTGAAYVPIDPNYPEERINHILEKSNPCALITQSTFYDFCNRVTNEKIPSNLLININQFTWGKYNNDNPNLCILASNLMYLIFTSGSTGIPKGALIEHRSAVNMAYACIKKLAVCDSSRILQISSFSFDVAVAEWCMAFMSGASLYLINKDIFSPNLIHDYLKKNKITTIILSSSIFNALPKKPLPDLAVVAVGGEPVSQATVNYWAPMCKFINVYGITETTVCSTMGECFSNQSKFTIGKPLANTKIYLLNNEGNLVPIYGAGEIYIGGIGVARGYVNDISLTNEKFISNPFVSTKNEYESRLYKTGDIGRWSQNGEIEYLGRIDDQIKIRGFRVELTEIEKTLQKYPDIDKAVVVVNTISNHKQLQAFVTTTKKQIDLIKIQEFLAAHLASYMLPP